MKLERLTTLKLCILFTLFLASISNSVLAANYYWNKLKTVTVDAKLNVNTDNSVKISGLQPGKQYALAITGGTGISITSPSRLSVTCHGIAVLNDNTSQHMFALDGKLDFSRPRSYYLFTPTDSSDFVHLFISDYHGYGYDNQGSVMVSLFQVK